MAELPDRAELLRQLEQHLGRALTPAERDQLDLLLRAELARLGGSTAKRHAGFRQRSKERLRDFFATVLALALYIGAFVVFDQADQAHPPVWVFLALPTAIAIFVVFSGFPWWLLLVVIPVSVVVFPIALIKSGDYLGLAASGLGFVVVGGVCGYGAASSESRGLAVNAFFAMLGGIIMIILGVLLYFLR